MRRHRAAACLMIVLLLIWCSAAAGQTTTTTKLASGDLRLVATDYSLGEASVLTPSDLLTTELLETPAVASIQLPAKTKRTNLLVCASAPHNYQQVASSSPFRFTGSFRLKWTSAILPAPGSFTFGVGLDSIIESAPSSQDVFRSFDPVPCVAIDSKLLTALLVTTFSLPEAEAAVLAKDFLESEIQLDLSLRARVQSVQAVTVTNGTLQVYSD